MITINLVCVGKLSKKFLVEAVAEYTKRMSKFCKFNIIEVAEERLPKNPKDKDILISVEKETKKIEKLMQGYTILLDVLGVQITSEQFAKKIDNISLTSSHITFIIGGSYGVADFLKQKVDYTLSFSKFTFPHQLMRLIFVEQLYRAITINNNITYHK